MSFPGRGPVSPRSVLILLCEHVVEVRDGVFADAAALSVRHNAPLAAMAARLEPLLHALDETQIFRAEHRAIPLDQFLLISTDWRIQPRWRSRLTRCKSLV